MTADELANALTSGGAGWLVLSVAAILPILWAFTLVLHFARPYIIRFLGTLTLRFGGDVWWLSYVLIRDGLMLVTLALSMIFLMPNLYIGLGLPITAPLATVVLAWALAVKLTRDSDDDVGRVPDREHPPRHRLDPLHRPPDLRPRGGRPGRRARRRRRSRRGPGAPCRRATAPGAINDWAWPILNVSLVLVGAHRGRPVHALRHAARAVRRGGAPPDRRALDRRARGWQWRARRGRTPRARNGEATSGSKLRVSVRRARVQAT